MIVFPLLISFLTLWPTGPSVSWELWVGYLPATARITTTPEDSLYIRLASSTLAESVMPSASLKGAPHPGAVSYNAPRSATDH